MSLSRSPIWMPRMIQESRRLLEIFQPPDAFLFLDGNPGRIDLLFKRCRALEFLAGPELNGRQPQRHSSIITARLECIADCWRAYRIIQPSASTNSCLGIGDLRTSLRPHKRGQPSVHDDLSRGRHRTHTYGRSRRTEDFRPRRCRAGLVRRRCSNRKLRSRFR